MKKIFLLLLGAVITCTVSAQVLEKNESAVVYYSPKTEVKLDFRYTVEQQEAGIYAAYAEELLGISDAVKENSIVYTLKSVHIGTTTQTDYNRPHKVRAEDGIPMLLAINKKGILTGYNQPIPAPMPPKTTNNHKKPNGERPSKVMPFNEEVLKATDSAGMAEAVAQQILHLRETRLFLLSGEVEHAPADGEAMRLVLDELNQQEKALTELFVGKRIRRTEHQVFTIAPDSIPQYFFFSAENGFTDADNIDADTIHVQMTLNAQQYQQEEEMVVTGKKGKKTATPELSPIVYNLPGSAEVKVVYQDHRLGSKIIPVAQLGIDVPLPKALFTGEQAPVIVFDEKTGNIQSINK